MFKGFLYSILFFCSIAEVRSQSAEVLRKCAAEKVAEGDYYMAKCHYDKLLEMNPMDTNAYFDRGMFKEYLGDFAGAVEDFTAAITLDKENVDSYFLRGMDKEKLGDYLGAIHDYKKTVELEDDNSDAHVYMANCYVRIGNYNEALLSVNRAVVANPENAQAYAARGWIKYLQADYPNAEADLKLSVSLDSVNFWANFYLAVVRQQNNDFAGAFQLLSQLVKENYYACRISGADFTLFNRPGFLAQLSTDGDSNMEKVYSKTLVLSLVAPKKNSLYVMESLIKAFPGRKELLCFVLAVSEMVVGLEEKKFEEARSLNPRNVQLLLAYANWNLSVKRFETSMELVNLVLLLEPYNPGALKLSVSVYQALNREDEACNQLAKWLRHGGAFKENNFSISCP